MPNVGDRVKVWPAPGHPVRELHDNPRLLPADGVVCTWSPWLESKQGSGEVYLTDPTPRPAAPAAAPKPAKE